MDNFASFLEDLARGVPAIVEAISVVTMEVTESNMKQRIFEDGIASGGEKLKHGDKYSATWSRVRLSAGRQVNKIDLQFTGDTLRGINTVKSSLGANIIFNNQKNADKIRELEENPLWNQKITDPTTAEAAETTEYFEKLFNTTIDELAKRHNISL